MNYRHFLQDHPRELRLPYAGGLKVRDATRTWRLRYEIPPGWYRFRESGRFLEVHEVIESELHSWRLPAARGYLAQGRFVTDEAVTGIFGFTANEDSPRYTPILARRWFDGRLWFEMPDFEGEAESDVRESYEEDRPIRGIKGVAPGLAHAFLLDQTAREMARAAERRKLEQADARHRAAELVRWESSVDGRIALALSHSGAELLDWRRSGGNRATVRYRLASQRFECVIDSDSLQILDAGICLDGEDASLNLSSLPSAVREAIDTGQLHVWRPG